MFIRQAKFLSLMTIFTFLTIFWNNFPASAATDKSYDLQKSCRENLRKLKTALEDFIQKENKDIPEWATFDSVYKMLLTTKYLPDLPVLPTSDCSYFLVYKSPKVFDWYCDLHGVENGDEKVTFRYHEFQFTGQIATKYLAVEKYKRHAENLRRWLRYSPTLMENIQFHYKRNPTSTVLMVVVGLFVLLFIYRNVFSS
ncbi:MAG: hypothetical protein HQM10_14305 [Candidatus Riflebacteria bacterium]|nr:hypothetical protein [Candidatus Riflebacteria bacterium]